MHERDRFSDDCDAVVVTYPGSSDSFRLRWPTFAEWHDIVTSHQPLNGKAPPAELVAKTIAVCLAGENGKGRADGRATASIMNGSPRRVMWLYRTCLETVLRSDEEAVVELEKN